MPCAKLDEQQKAGTCRQSLPEDVRAQLQDVPPLALAVLFDTGNEVLRLGLAPPLVLPLANPASRSRAQKGTETLNPPPPSTLRQFIMLFSITVIHTCQN